MLQNLNTRQIYLWAGGIFLFLYTVITMADNSAHYSNELLQEKFQALQAYTTQTINELQATATTTVLPAPDHAHLDLFPIQSTLLTPGDVTARTMNLPRLVQPIFLMGSDNLSQSWLKQNIDKLVALHAIGFLVQANSESDFEMMKELAGDLTLIPMNADAFAKQWNLQHYPVLITAQGVTQ
jgi:integrating conjugative element protein (TIGR03765 family)